MNGSSHSPTAINGTPSTPNGFSNGPATSSTASLSTQHLPPACGARQLSKLKRFLTTLQQFGSDISPEIGERVRTLVLGLVVSLGNVAKEAMCLSREDAVTLGHAQPSGLLPSPGWADGAWANMRWFSPPQNSTLTIEEFHSKLQEATNFPLRPFVIPFLKVMAKLRSLMPVLHSLPVLTGIVLTPTRTLGE